MQSHNFKTLFDPEQPIFFTSDLHFYHNNIIKFCNRPFSNIQEMNNKLIENWNRVVPKDGIVFNLGDICFGGSKELDECLSKLNGKQILIIGNHDYHNLQDGSMRYFEYVTSQMFIKIGTRSIYLNHYPFLCYGGSLRPYDKAVFQLFGHVHTSRYKNDGEDFKLMKYCNSYQYDVGVDFNDYTPIPWSLVEERISIQSKKKVNYLYWINHG